MALPEDRLDPGTPIPEENFCYTGGHTVPAIPEVKLILGTIGAILAPKPQEILQVPKTTGPEDLLVSKILDLLGQKTRGETETKE